MDRELPAKVTVCQSILSGRNMEDALRSFCEMGVTDVIPVRTEKVFEVPSRDNEAQTVRRWGLCARVYQRNSLREDAPTVHTPVNFADAVSLARDYDVAILAYENETDPDCTRKAMEACKGAKSIIVFIGPERGFAPEEVELATNSGIQIVSLGKRIIRAVNAGAVLMGMIVYALELDGGRNYG